MAGIDPLLARIEGAREFQRIERERQIEEALAPARAQEEADRLEALRGPKGDPGEPGTPGRDGRDGLDGVNGKPGKDGRDGADGVDGRNGADGRDGEDGAPGTAGPRGHHGPPGATEPAIIRSELEREPPGSLTGPIVRVVDYLDNGQTRVRAIERDSKGRPVAIRTES